MALTISASYLTSDMSPHWAHRDAFEPDWWWVTWLPAGQVCDRSQAISAMTLAELVAHMQQDGRTTVIDYRHRLWPHVGNLAAELMLTGPQAMAMVSNAYPDRDAGALPAAGPDAFINPSGQVKDLSTGHWFYVTEGLAQAKANQAIELAAQPVRSDVGQGIGVPRPEITVGDS